MERFIHFSALGASHDAKSEFLRVKVAACDYSAHSHRSQARSEEAVLREFPAATIVRPAITTGWEDNFLLKWARVCKTWPMVPIPTPSGYVQPIDVIYSFSLLCICGVYMWGVYVGCICGVYMWGVCVCVCVCVCVSSNFRRWETLRKLFYEYSKLRDLLAKFMSWLDPR